MYKRQLVFFLTFNVIGLFFQNLMEMGIDALTGIVDTALTNWNVNAAVHSLVIDGIFTGVGSVLSFLPIIVVLFFCLLYQSFKKRMQQQG